MSIDDKAIPIAAAVAATAADLIPFDVTYLTRSIDLDPRAKHAMQQGLVVYQVWARNAADAIERLVESEPIEHPVVRNAAGQPEIESVTQTPPFKTGEPRQLGRMVLPREMQQGNVKSGLGLISH